MKFFDRMREEVKSHTAMGLAFYMAVGRLVEDTQEEIRKAEGYVAWLTKRIGDLELEAASLPTVGFHRPKYLETRKILKKVKRALRDEQEYLDGLRDRIADDRELETMMSPEDIESWKKFEEEQRQELDARLARSQEADKRRDQFRLILGGKG